MKLCDVNTFDLGEPKEKALKPLEEAAEVFAEYQKIEKWKNAAVVKMLITPDALYEIADCITACCNLAAYLGCDDLTEYLKAVEKSNRERGRYGMD